MTCYAVMDHEQVACKAFELRQALDKAINLAREPGTSLEPETTAREADCLGARRELIEQKGPI